MHRFFAVLAAVLSLIAAPALAQTQLRVAMTAADIPRTVGQPDQGGEGIRFIGLTLYDGLINYDLSKRDESAKLRPALATDWSTDPADRRIWTFKLRPGVKFHDGSAFNADAVVWNLDKLMNDKSPQYDKLQFAQVAEIASQIAGYKKIDDLTVQIVGKLVDATFPYSIARLYYSSPARFEEVGRDWNKFAERPSGTGPWMLTKLVLHERAELARFPGYWDPERVPKTDKLVLLPIPDASTRTAALLSGQVDWVEAPSPDAIARLKSSGMQIVTNIYPHIWPFQVSNLPGSPFADVRVRKAANLAIDRDGLVKLLGGTAIPAKGQVDPKHPWFGAPSFDIKYDPDGAKKLLAEAGYGPGHPLKVAIAISTAGSGQMQPLPMNEFIQENWRDVGIEVEFKVMEWEALRTLRRLGAAAPECKGIVGINNSWAYWDPIIGILGPALSSNVPPAGNNWGAFSDPEIDALGVKARQAFDVTEQNEILAQIHSRMVDQAEWIWVVHDLNPRALSPRVTGFVQAQSWFQDLTPVVMK
jgi:peptide/nickel transport system substrate-binding protein